MDLTVFHDAFLDGRRHGSVSGHTQRGQLAVKASDTQSVVVSDLDPAGVLNVQRSCRKCTSSHSVAKRMEDSQSVLEYLAPVFGNSSKGLHSQPHLDPGHRYREPGKLARTAGGLNVAVGAGTVTEMAC